MSASRDIRAGARNLLINCAELSGAESLLIVREDPDLGWYDGQTWEKPLSWREQDLLVARHEVRPILGRLGRAMATAAGLMLGGASLCQAL